jgi:glycosyltransferase involved in cell wall biosynthesis
MTITSKEKDTSPPRILMLSQRNIYPSDLWRSPHYEFEDLICQFDSVELFAPRPKPWFRMGNKIARSVARYSPLAWNPAVPRTEAKKNYDMLFMFCSYPSDLLSLNLGPRWKERFKTSICMIDEIWVKDIPRQKLFLKILSAFDRIVLYYSQSTKAISEVTGKRTYFVPPGIDAIKFCPYPNLPKRVIDVYSLGRRSQATHQKLLDLAKARNLFYIYDSLLRTGTINAKEHRELLANMTKRTRFFIVNPGCFDEPEKRGHQIEIGNRYFKGAAAGCIMIGEIPGNEAYKNLFNWPDAVLPLSYGSDQIETIIDEIDRQPEREKEIRKNNIVQSLRRHDWVYRWESVLKIAGLEPTPRMRERQEQLEKLAALAEGQTTNLA